MSTSDAGGGRRQNASKERTNFLRNHKAGRGDGPKKGTFMLDNDDSS